MQLGLPALQLVSRLWLVPGFHPGVLLRSTFWKLHCGFSSLSVGRRNTGHSQAVTSSFGCPRAARSPVWYCVIMVKPGDRDPEMPQGPSVLHLLYSASNSSPGLLALQTSLDLSHATPLLGAQGELPHRLGFHRSALLDGKTGEFCRW